MQAARVSLYYRLVTNTARTPKVRAVCLLWHYQPVPPKVSVENTDVASPETHMPMMLYFSPSRVTALVIDLAVGPN